MKRMGEFKNITGPALVGEKEVMLTGDVRVRVDLAALAAQYGPPSLKARGCRVSMCNGAVVVEAFGVHELEREIPVVVLAGGHPVPGEERRPGTLHGGAAGGDMARPGDSCAASD